MRAVLQCVSSASVTVNGGAPRAIGPGLVILLGIKNGDTPALAERLAQKCAELRIFPDEDDKLNCSAASLGYSALVVSNFTLYGDASHGRRPSYTAAAKPPLSVELYEAFLRAVQRQGLREVQHGEFGADMRLTLVNEGPVTLILDTDDWA